jgi:hypothetical protein
MSRPIPLLPVFDEVLARKGDYVVQVSRLRIFAEYALYHSLFFRLNFDAKHVLLDTSKYYRNQARSMILDPGAETS